MGNAVVFPLSFLFFWIKGTFYNENGVLYIEQMNTVFGIIPAGKRAEAIPIRSISGCAINKFYDTSVIITGVLLIIAGLFNVSTITLIPAGVLLIICGILILLSGVFTTITIQNNGTWLSVNAPFYARSAAEEAKAMIDHAIIDYAQTH